LAGHILQGGSLEKLYAALEEMEKDFEEAYRKAEAAGCRRRFVAFLEKDGDCYRAGIGMKDVDGKHPAYHLRGTENAIIIRSAFHPYPLVIAGAGEGAREAASSLLNDILK
jgi:homoserine dehydrogenase